MGIDIGFDFFPALKDTPADNALWSRFLQEVINTYKTDPNFNLSEKRLTFTVGEYPFLPKQGFLFRRFSSKVSGGCGKAETYIRQVLEIAQKYFNRSQLHYWSEYGYGGEPDSVYSWGEVNKMNKMSDD